MDPDGTWQQGVDGSWWCFSGGRWVAAGGDVPGGGVPGGGVPGGGVAEGEWQQSVDGTWWCFSGGRWVAAGGGVPGGVPGGVAEGTWQQGPDGSWWCFSGGRWVAAGAAVAPVVAARRGGGGRIALVVTACVVLVALFSATVWGMATLVGAGRTGDGGRGGRGAAVAAGDLSGWIDEVERFWALNEGAVVGLDYEALNRGSVYTDSSDSLECGGETYGPDMLAGNAFYCTEDYVYLDGELLEVLGDEVGPTVPVYVVAHEFGHRVQHLSDSFPDTTLAAELQADCYAAAFVADAVQRGSVDLGEDPLGDVLRASVVIGDGVELSASDPEAHGTGFDRAGAAWTGWNDGVSACVALGEDPPETVQGSLPPGGGDGDIDRELVVPVVLDVLAATFPGRAVSPGDVVDRCPDGGRGTRACADGSLAVDEDEVSELYDDFGDMAAWVPVVAGYVDLDDREWDSWCAVGALAGELVVGVDSASAGTTIYLSGEDLDELLAQVSQEADGADGFARVEVVRRGFTGGWAAC